jgi:hypothetical protein
MNVSKYRAMHTSNCPPRNDPNDTAPTESDPEETEETHIEAIGSSLDLGQDLSIVFGDSGWQGLASLLGLCGRGCAI